VIKGFRDFIMRGNVIDLAVAFVIGVAFVAVVGAFTTGILDPLIAAVFGKPDLSSVGTFDVNGAHFSIGLFLTALLNFLLVAATVYFVIVVPMNKLKSRSAKAEEPAGPSEVDLLTEIRDALRDRP
jgi:large conductance mechanosensitive channel